MRRVSCCCRGHQGVLLPNLGTFRVGPIIGESKKKIRTLFTLLEGRYGSVSQERPKHNIGAFQHLHEREPRATNPQSCRRQGPDCSAQLWTALQRRCGAPGRGAAAHR